MYYPTSHLSYEPIHQLILSMDNVFNFLYYQIILTKSDVSSAVELKKALASCFLELMDRKKTSSMPFVHVVSSKSGDGMLHLQQSMTEILSHDWIANDPVPM